MDSSPFKQGFKFGMGYLAARFVVGAFVIASVLSFVFLLSR